MAQQYGTGTFRRTSVTKMLAAEVSRTTHDLPRGEGQYESQTYLSPTGRTVAKVMICGTAIEKEDIGKDQSLWRMRVADPSGTVGVMAGMYQPEAAQVIAQLEIPCYIAIVGKLNVYEPESGSQIVSIRPDSVTVIDGKTRDDLILDAALGTARSIKKCATDLEIQSALETAYGVNRAETEAYMLVAQQAMESLLPTNLLSADKGLTKSDDQNKEPPACDATCNDKAGEDKTPPPAGDKNQPKKKETKPAEPPKTKEKPASTKSSPSSYPDKEKKEKKDVKQEKTGTIDSSIKTIQEVVLEVLREKKEVMYTDLPDLLKNKGINPNVMDWESAVKRLMQEGLVCEPKLGKLKAIV